MRSTVTGQEQGKHGPALKFGDILPVATQRAGNRHVDSGAEKSVILDDKRALALTITANDAST